MRRLLTIQVSFGVTCLAALAIAACSSSGGGQGSTPDAGSDVSSGGDGPTTNDSATGGDTGTGNDSPAGDGPVGPGDAAGDASCAVIELPSPMCNDIVASGPLVMTTTSAGTPPQPQGGAVADGTYVLQTATYYGGSPSMQTFQTTWVICGDSWDVIDNLIAADGGVTPIHVNYTASVQGSAIVLNPRCASLQSVNTSMNVSFSVSGGQLTLFQTVQGGVMLVSAFAGQ
jgi:hypothetical protein